MIIRKKITLFAILCFIVFSSLIFYNYSRAQQNLSSKSSSFSVALIKPPQLAKIGEPVTFYWEVNSTGNFSTSQTAIYWSFHSSPSALIQTDSPSALGYPYHSPDYATGIYKLPFVFDANFTFDKPGPVYFRAMSYIEKNYYWTPEYILLVEE